MRSIRRLLLPLVAVALLLAGIPASATVIHPDYLGTDFDFTGIQETSTFGDPEPLFGAPIGIGNQLLFFPPNFSASSAGGGVDQTGAQLQLMIMGQSATDTIDTITIEEFGDALLAGVGTAATGTFAGMAGFITVLEVSGVAVAPTVIGFTGTFTPSDTLTLPTDPGATLWSAIATIDVAASVANATKVMVSLNNDLFAFSEATTSALIQKKVVDGPGVIITVPEPGTLSLLASCLFGACLLTRVRRP